MIVQRKPGVYSKRVGSVWLILEPGKKYIRHLNSVAGFVWSMTERPVSVRAITEAVTARYDVSANEAQKDVSEFVTGYLREGFLEEVRS